MIPGSRWSSGRIALKVCVACRAPALDRVLRDRHFGVGVTDAHANPAPRRLRMTSIAPGISGAIVSIRT